MDYYKLLEIKINAEPHEIVKAYRKAIFKHHPDRGGNSDTFFKVQEAYKVLSDPVKRKKYNRKFKKQQTSLEKDPNLGKVWDVPPPKEDLWGNPIQKSNRENWDKMNYESDEEMPWLR